RAPRSSSGARSRGATEGRAPRAGPRGGRAARSRPTGARRHRSTTARRRSCAARRARGRDARARSHSPPVGSPARWSRRSEGRSSGTPCPPRRAQAIWHRDSGARRNAARRPASSGSISDLVQPAADSAIVDTGHVELRVTSNEDRDTHDVPLEKRGVPRDVDTFDVERRPAAEAPQRGHGLVAQAAVGTRHQPNAYHQFAGRPGTFGGNATPSGWITYTVPVEPRSHTVSNSS